MSIPYKPAEYHKQQAKLLDSDVTIADMTSHFLTFMQTDQLGRICNYHMRLADYSPSGTFDPNCIELAEIASTAIDFSKHGIAPDMERLAKIKMGPFYPDFVSVPLHCKGKPVHEFC